MNNVRDELRFSSSYSRNGLCWTQEKDKSGRLYLKANGKGVKLLCGMVFDYVVKHSGSTKDDILSFLLRKHSSFTMSDLSQPLRKLEQTMIIQSNAGEYTVTIFGKEIWKNINKEFIVPRNNKEKNRRQAA